jgi:hypothetical protein
MSTRYNFFGGLVTDSLILNLDAAKLQSYPGTGTNWYDISGNNNNGTLTNGPTLTGSGKNLAIRFDGTNDYVDVIPPNFNRSETSICMFYRYDNPTVNYPLLMGNGTSTSNESFYITSLGPTYGASNLGKISAFFKAGNTTNQVTGRIDLVSNIVTTGSSFYLVVTYKTNGTANMYINGTFHLSKPTTSDLLNPQVGSFVLGGGSPVPVASDPFNGNISTFQMYNKALSPFDVYQNFNALKGRYGIPDIVTSGLTLNLDAGNPYSYNPLNTSSTTWVDTTYTTTGGTLINGTFYSGGTMVFDGTDDYARVSDINTASEISIEGWVYANSVGSFNAIASQFQADNLAESSWVLETVGSDIRLYITNNSLLSFASTSFSTLVWTYIVGTFNGTTIKIYKNSVLGDITGTIAGLNDSNLNINIGALYSQNGSEGGTGLWNGKIANVKIYNRALSQAEVLNNYNATKSRFGL